MMLAAQSARAIMLVVGVLTSVQIMHGAYN